MAEKTGNGISREGYLRENYRYFHLRDTSGSEHDFHFHEFAKAVLLQSGRAEYIVEQVTYTLRPGSILLVPHHAIHKAVIDQTEPYDRVILYLNRQYFERFMPTAGLMACFDRADIRGSCLLMPDEANRRDIRRTLAEYEAAEKDSEPGAEAIRDAIMLQLLLRIERVSRLVVSRMPETEGTAEAIRQGSGRLEKLLTYINENLSADLTVDALAERACLSRYHFMHLFRACTGTTAHAYVRQRRLLAAARLIRNGTPAGQAAAACGFGDYSSFCRAFHSTFGTRPSDLK